MRCPDCNKFVSLETQEPEVDLELDFDGEDARITGTVRVARSCAECGQELKETTFDVDHDVELPEEFKHKGDGHELELDADSGESTESGGGRYEKNMIGFEVSYSIRCSCQNKDAEPVVNGTISDSLAASQFDELV